MAGGSICEETGGGPLVGRVGLRDDLGEVGRMVVSGSFEDKILEKDIGSFTRAIGAWT